MEAKLSNLSINPAPLNLSKERAGGLGKAKGPVADSWEDDEAGGGSDNDSNTSTEQNTTTKPSRAISHAPSSSTDYPSAPPPTPVSPTASFPTWESSSSIAGPRNPSTGIHRDPQLRHPEDAEDSDRRRPEKSTATAGRLIAAGLGMKPPKQNEEQKAYEKATRENEMRRRQREKEEIERRKAEDERARRDVWDS